VGQPEDLSTIVMIESVDGGAVRGYTRSTAVLRTLRLLLAPWWLAYWLGVMVPRALRDLVYMQVRVVSRRVAEGAEITRRRHKSEGWCQSMRAWLSVHGSGGGGDVNRDTVPVYHIRWRGIGIGCSARQRRAHYPTECCGNACYVVPPRS
jgi:hypothetical protein